MAAIKRVSLSEQVYSSILEYVTDNNLQIGDKLPTEGEFADLFQVSRTSVREAMKALSLSGAVESIPGKGTFICAPMMNFIFKDHANEVVEATGYISQIMEVRTAIEVLAAELAVDRATDSDIKQVSDAMDDLRKAVESGAPWALQGSRFHIQIAESSKNPLVVSIIESYSEAVGRYRDAMVDKNTDIDMVHHIEEHEAILNALKARDKKAMVAAVKKHMKNTEANLKRLVNENSASEFIIG